MLRWILLLFSSILTINGYVFSCLDRCECDTTDRTVHCHNANRDRFQLPDEPLHGFRIIGMTRNDIRYLPSEDALKESFPDLIAIDVEANPNFDCSTLDQYTKIQVLSNCGKDATELDNIIVDTVQKPTDECDVKCQLDYHYQKLHEYVQKILKVIKQKLEEAQKHPVVKDVKNWFAELIEKVKKMEFRSPIVIKDE